MSKPTLNILNNMYQDIVIPYLTQLLANFGSSFVKFNQSILSKLKAKDFSPLFDLLYSFPLFASLAEKIKSFFDDDEDENGKEKTSKLKQIFNKMAENKILQIIAIPFNFVLNSQVGGRALTIAFIALGVAGVGVFGFESVAVLGPVFVGILASFAILSTVVAQIKEIHSNYCLIRKEYKKSLKDQLINENALNNQIYKLEDREKIIEVLNEQKLNSSTYASAFAKGFFDEISNFLISVLSLSAIAISFSFASIFITPALKASSDVDNNTYTKFLKNETNGLNSIAKLEKNLKENTSFTKVSEYKHLFQAIGESFTDYIGKTSCKYIGTHQKKFATECKTAMQVHLP